VLFDATVVDAASSTRLVRGLRLLLIVSQQKERFSALATSWFQSDRDFADMSENIFVGLSDDLNLSFDRMERSA
jgi:hypothetical protein